MNYARMRGWLQTLWSPKVLNPGAALCCVGLIIASFVFEKFFGEDPCPLCYFQRYFVVIVGVFFVLATSLHYLPRCRRAVFFGVALFSALFAFLVLPESAGFFSFAAFQSLIEQVPLFLRYLLFASFVVYAAVYLLGAFRWVGTKGLYRITGFVLLFAAVLGAATSMRHIWIQMLPGDMVPACTPPLDFMVQIQGVWGAINQTFLIGSGDCHDSSWSFLFLTMPMWVLVWFIGLGVFGFLRNGIFAQES